MPIEIEESDIQQLLGQAAYDLKNYTDRKGAAAADNSLRDLHNTFFRSQSLLNPINIFFSLFIQINTLIGVKFICLFLRKFRI